MMGGLGSGRPSGFGQDTVESCRSLDVNRLNRAGYIGTRRYGGWHWTRDGERVASINLIGEGNRIKLSYRAKAFGEDWVDVIETVPIAYAPCNLGGKRPYFVCPGIVNGQACGRRVVKLYGPGRYFLCRHCYRLAYASQSEDAADRTMRRANKLRMRLGGNPGLEMPLPGRPKGMWRQTYDRRLAEIIEADERADEAFVDKSMRLLARFDNPLAGEWLRR